MSTLQILSILSKRELVIKVTFMIQWLIPLSFFVLVKIFCFLLEGGWTSEHYQHMAYYLVNFSCIL